MLVFHKIMEGKKMMEKGRISSLQMAMMMYPTIVGTAIVNVPSITGRYAKNDLWISPIWASIIGFLTVLIACQLHKIYPKQTLIQYSEQTVGRHLGKVLGLMYMIFYIIMNGHGIRIYAEFIVGAFLQDTPISIVIFIMILMCGFAVYTGLETIGRIGQLLFPFFVLPPMISVFLLFPELELQNIFPIMENGIMPSIKGAFAPQAWFGEFLLIAFILPFLADAEKGRKWAVLSTVLVMLTLVLVNLLILFLLGETTASYVYPLLHASRYMSFASFIDNLEAAVMAVWILGNFVKFSVVYYCLVLGTAQWLNLSDYRPIVFPIGLWTMIFSFWSIPNQMTLSQYTTLTGFPLYSLLFQTFIPFLLLLIAIVRKHRTKSIHEGV